MDKKKIIKTAINVLPIVIVPLVVERKRIKSHLRYKKQLMQRQMQDKRLRIKQQVQEYLGDKTRIRQQT